MNPELLLGGSSPGSANVCIIFIYVSNLSLSWGASAISVSWLWAKPASEGVSNTQNISPQTLGRTSPRAETKQPPNPWDVGALLGNLFQGLTPWRSCQGKGEGPVSIRFFVLLVFLPFLTIKNWMQQGRCFGASTRGNLPVPVLHRDTHRVWTKPCPLQSWASRTGTTTDSRH